MLSWIVDNASLLYLFLLCAALVLLARWWMTRNRRYLAALGAVAGGAALVWLLTLAVDTDRKQIARALHEMAEGMKDRPPDRVFRNISERFSSPFAMQSGTLTLTKAQLRDKALKAQRSYSLEEVVIRDLEFQSVTGTEAVVLFSAQPIVGDALSVAFPCEAKFVRETDGRWRMIGLKIFNPFVNTDKLFVLPL